MQAISGHCLSNLFLIPYTRDIYLGVAMETSRVTDQSIDECKKLYRLAQKKRKPENDYSEKSERCGSYCVGWKQGKQTWTVTKSIYKVVAAHINRIVMSPAQDFVIITRTLEVFRGKRLIFMATQNGEVETTRFGPGEMYEGREQKKAEDWRVSRGKMPQALKAMVSRKKK